MKNKTRRNFCFPDENHWDWMGLGSGEWSRWVARWVLCAPSQPSQPTSGGPACLSRVSDLLSGQPESSESSFVVGPLLVPYRAPFRCAQSSFARFIVARVLCRSLDTRSGIVGKRDHGRVPIPGSWPTTLSQIRTKHCFLSSSARLYLFVPCASIGQKERTSMNINHS